MQKATGLLLEGYGEALKFLKPPKFHLLSITGVFNIVKLLLPHPAPKGGTFGV